MFNSVQERDVKVIFVKTSIVTVMDMSFVIIKYCLSLIRSLLALGTGVSYDMSFVIINYCLSQIRNLLALGTVVSYDMSFDLSFVLII